VIALQAAEALLEICANRLRSEVHVVVAVLAADPRKGLFRAHAAATDMRGRGSLRSADSRRATCAPRAGKRSEAERGKRRQCRAPLASGFLTDGFVIDALEEGDFRRAHPFAQRADLADLRREIGGTVGAIRFVLGHPAVTGAIVGVRNEREAREIVRSTP
jgi:hypothetical protein